MVCSIDLWHHPLHHRNGGHTQQYTMSTGDLTDNNKPFNRNYATWQKVKADENCLITAYTCPNYDSGGDCDAVMTREGEDNIWNNPGGLGATGRSFNDDYDSIRISAVPSGIGKLKYHISTISQKPLSFRNPVGNIGNNQQVYYNQTQKFLPCPGAEKVYFNSKSGIRCIYSKTDGSGLRTLYNNKANFKSNQGAMLSTLQNEFCDVRDNAFKDPGGGACFEKTQGAAIAKRYCAVGDRIVSDVNCSKENLMDNNWKQLAEAYCRTSKGRGDQFCSCYNVLNNVCASHPTAAGCADKKRTYDALLEKVPDNQKNFLSGMETCFGGVCAGNKFLPDGYNSNCNRTVNICVQDIDIRGMTDSNIQAYCDIESTDSTPGAPGASGAPGAPGASGTDGAPGASGTDGADGADGADGSLDTTTKIGGLLGILIISCMCMMILLLLASSSGKKVPGRFRR